MTFQSLSVKASIGALSLLALSASSAYCLPVHNVPAVVGMATDLGRVDPAKEMNLTVVLKMHDQDGFDQAVADLYTPGSLSFHQWLTDADLERYAPTAAEYEIVRSQLVQQGFSVISSDPRRLTLRVHGTAAIVESAFQTELHTFQWNGTTFQAHIRDASLEGPAGDLIDSVSGIEVHQARPKLTIARNPKTGEAVFEKQLTSKADQAAFFASLTDTPLTPSVTLSLTSFGSLPTAIYSGMEYDASGAPVGFTPSQLQAHYGLAPLYAKGYDGAGETTVLVEAYGYPQAESDANAAAAACGLPALDSKTFSVVYPEGQPVDPNAGVTTGWYLEIALDIQAAHALAPGAKIVVVASAGQDNEDLLASLDYVVSRRLGYAVSDSWEVDQDFAAGPLEEESFNSVLKTAASEGISFQFSSGDGGDGGLGTPVGAPNVPSNSPDATAVGGTSILNNPYGSGQIVTGWGNLISELYLDAVTDPMFGLVVGGAGGGQSIYYKKPAWQHALAGDWRLVPDVAAVADPFTGFGVIYTSNSTQYGEVIGGTSLSSPLFTAIWTVADQYNGRPLGQAAPAVSRLTSSQISDVTPPAATIASYDVTGSLTGYSGTTTFTPASIFTSSYNPDTESDLSLYSQTDFLSALWNLDDGVLIYALSFGTDSSLTVTKGWDNVTGWGEPNGLPFIQGVTGKTVGAKVD
jgi:subtilase family serine protease